MLSKTMQTLIERAERKGSAVKRVREGMVMGSGYEYASVETRKNSPMIEQWKVEYKQDLNQDASVFKEYKVYHYGTLIFHIDNNCAGGWVLVDWYGESNSDRDALNGLCSYFGINAGFTYRPVNGGFQMV